MMTGQAPQPEFFDMSDELDRIAREAGLIYNDGGWLWPTEPSSTSGSDPFIPPAVFGDDYAPEPTWNPPLALQTVSESQMMVPMITLSPYGFGEGNWVDSERPVLGAGDFPACPLYDLPPAPGPRTIPLPPTSWGYLSDSYEAKDSDAHQFPLEGMGVSAQEAESSTSLAAAKPEIIENNDQSEHPSSPAPSGSRGGYDRARNAQGKQLCLSQICDALRIPREEDVDELSTLRRITRSVGGTVPDSVSMGQLPKPQRQARNRRGRRECFEELMRLFCPGMTAVHELRILESVLAGVTSQAGEPQGPEGEYQPFGVFRA